MRIHDHVDYAERARLRRLRVLRLHLEDAERAAADVEGIWRERLRELLMLARVEIAAEEGRG